MVFYNVSSDRVLEEDGAAPTACSCYECAIWSFSIESRLNFFSNIQCPTNANLCTFISYHILSVVSWDNDKGITNICVFNIYFFVVFFFPVQVFFLFVLFWLEHSPLLLLHVFFAVFTLTFWKLFEGFCSFDKSSWSLEQISQQGEQRCLPGKEKQPRVSSRNIPTLTRDVLLFWKCLINALLLFKFFLFTCFWWRYQSRHSCAIWRLAVKWHECHITSAETKLIIITNKTVSCFLPDGSVSCMRWRGFTSYVPYFDKTSDAMMVALSVTYFTTSFCW